MLRNCERVREICYHETCVDVSRKSSSQIPKLRTPVWGDGGFAKLFRKLLTNFSEGPEGSESPTLPEYLFFGRSPFGHSESRNPPAGPQNRTPTTTCLGTCLTTLQVILSGEFARFVRFKSQIVEGYLNTRPSIHYHRW